MAQCPAGYWGNGNAYGKAYCDGNWCNSWNPFSGNSYQRHVYLHCEDKNGNTEDVYAFTETIRCC